MPTQAQTVFITNRSTAHDYGSAARHGAIRFITSGNYPVFKTSRLIEEITEALIYSTPDDYLLFSGSSAIAGLCMSMWLELHGKANVLLWDRTQGEYVLRVFTRLDLRAELERAQDRLNPGATGRLVR